MRVPGFHHPNRYEMGSCNVGLHLSDANSVEHLSMCFLAICIASLRKVCSSILPIFKLGYFLLSCKSSLCILDTILIIYMTCEICLPFFSLSFTFFMISLTCKNLILMLFCLYFLFVAFVFGVLSKKPLTKSKITKIYTYFFSSNF